MQEFLVFLDYLSGRCLKALMHGRQGDFPLLPILVLAFLQNDFLVFVEEFGHDRDVLVLLLESTLTNVDNTELFAGGEHLSQGLSALACCTHQHAILPLLGLVHLDVALDREHLLFHHLFGFLRQLGQVVLFDLASKFLDIKHNLNRCILHILV